MSELLEAGYRRCAELTRAYGTTYYWGALLLPKRQRRDVYAVYALCRLADDIVDEPDKVDLSVPMTGTEAERLTAFRGLFFDAIARGTSDEPVMAAVADSITRRGTDPECFHRFFDAMALDLSRTTWSTWEELRTGYMEGSAAVIGEMMLPVLEPYSPAARQPARALGNAFQLTNFLRDVGEDLDRGRVYLPQDDLARHGADPWLRRVTPEWRSFMKEQIARNRELYAAAVPGLALLPPASRRCVATALILYSRILDRIEAADYDVFNGRHRVPGAEKLGVALRTVLLGPPQLSFPKASAAVSA
jgi:phytoene synthase